MGWLVVIVLWAVALVAAVRAVDPIAGALIGSLGALVLLWAVRIWQDLYWNPPPKPAAETAPGEAHPRRGLSLVRVWQFLSAGWVVYVLAASPASVWDIGAPLWYLAGVYWAMRYRHANPGIDIFARGFDPATAPVGPLVDPSAAWSTVSCSVQSFWAAQGWRLGELQPADRYPHRLLAAGCPDEQGPMVLAGLALYLLAVPFLVLPALLVPLAVLRRRRRRATARAAARRAAGLR